MESNMLSGSYHMQEHEDSSSDAESTTSNVHMARKKRKPLMEKRRRARINASLDQLKKLVLDAMKKDSARYSKLEKADILELTVRHLREGQQQHMNAAMSHDASVATKYKAGFTECASEVGRYLATIDGLSHSVRIRLMQHLSHCVQRVEQNHQASPSGMSSPLHMMHHIPNGQTYAHQVPQGSVQPLQIQIPSATTPSSLPGVSRCSPEPANLPPTPPSSAEHSFNTSFHFIPESIHSQFGQYPFPASQTSSHTSRVSSQEVLAPLKSKENISKIQGQGHAQRYSPYMKEHVMSSRKSPELLRGSIKTEMGFVRDHIKNNIGAVRDNIKEENMWRPW